MWHITRTHACRWLNEVNDLCWLKVTTHVFQSDICVYIQLLIYHSIALSLSFIHLDSIQCNGIVVRNEHLRVFFFYEHITNVLDNTSDVFASADNSIPCIRYNFYVSPFVVVMLMMMECGHIHQKTREDHVANAENALTD